MTREQTALFDLPPPATEAGTPPYRVLARQYRPKRFAHVVGQKAVVQVLTQALLQERLGHGFLFSGIRGIGKTTTARLLARALNCLALEKTSEGSVEPCGTCASCESFEHEKHLDIIEMDAASHTGVDDIREILEACRYRPVLGRYKIFIIDEVHMLSKSAFNALLKTLEEPPPHVKFIFATTEVRKIPATILSRCLRFDLKRLEPDILIPYLENICTREHIVAEPEALFLIARAGAGSARDSLSLLDQAIVVAGRTQTSGSAPRITSTEVRHMLGLLDPDQINGLFESVLQGSAALSLQHVRALYAQGLEPLMILEELTHLLHQLSCLKVDASDILKEQAAFKQTFLKEWEARVELPLLGRLWQMLLKGADEIRCATFPQITLEMLLIRVAYVTPLPTPDQLLKELKGDAQLPPPPHVTPLVQQQAKPDSRVVALPSLSTFQAVVKAVEARREGLLHTHLMQDVVSTTFAEGRITLALREGVPSDLCKRLEQFLKRETGRPWQVLAVNSQASDCQTLAEQKQDKERALHQAAEKHPVIEQARSLFPGVVVEEVRRVR